MTKLSRRTLLSGSSAVAGFGLMRGPLAATTAESADVIVVGAGLAGLYAARLLEAQGVTPLVLEASARPGGRVITLDDVPGKPEAGLAVIGGMYARALDLCGALNLPLEVPVQMRETEATRMLHIKGRNILEDDWEAAPENPFPEKWRHLKPDMAMSSIMMEEDPFSSMDDWISPEFNHLDISTRAYLSQRGLSEDAIDLINIGAFTNNLKDTSYLHYMRVWHWALASGPEMFTGARHIVGGMERLPEAMAQDLTTEVRYRKAVVSVEQDGDGARLLCSDGSRYRAKKVIFTCPLTVMRHIHFDHILPNHQSRAFNELPYVDAIQVYMVPTERFWEEDGMPPGMYTDTIIESIRPLAHGPDGELTNLIADLTGEGAYPYFLMSKEDIGEFILREMARIRPASEGKVVVAEVVNKTQELFARGDWPFWKPGQVTEYAQTFSKPAGPLHFAGDSTAVVNRGAEGALESGERAALEVLLAL